jgi:aspartate carbamoyltransferase catalytic subunit
VKSLAKLLRHYDAHISWVSPVELRIPKEFIRTGELETTNLHDTISDADVLYVTRVQKERMTTATNYNYIVSSVHMTMAKPAMVLMHPLPRIGEIPIGLDADPRAAYFRQMSYGLFMRMAVLAKVLGTESWG